MSDDLLEYYQRELAWIRRQGEEFAHLHPKIAGRLRLAGDTVEDPHVARLLEGFAFLTARVRKKLDDDFPELTDGILATLLPHVLQPVPSMAIVQCVADPQLTGGFLLPRETTIETDPVHGDPVRFRTAWPTTVWPIEVASARLGPAEGTPPEGAVAELRVTLRCASRTMTFARLRPPALRLFLRGQSQHALLVYELLCNHLVAVGLMGAGGRSRLLPAGALRPLGFGADEGILPFSPRTPHPHRLLTEFFAFPRKFQFVELQGLESALVDAGGELVVQFWLNRVTPELTRHVDGQAVVVNAVPVVNLYRLRAEPISLDQDLHEYRIVPDARRPLSHEVWSVDRVTALLPEGRQTVIPPLYDLRHADADPKAGSRFYYAARRPADPTRERVDAGTEVYLSLADLAMAPASSSIETLTVETTCSNRDLPSRLPFGGDQPRLQVVGGAAPLSKILCLTAPTPVVRPALGNGARWRLLSHLSLNHLALAGGAAGADALREILALYDPIAAPETRAMIQGIVQVDSRPAVARVSSLSAICRGIDVKVVLDPAKFTGGGLFLFASVLDRFLAMSCSINSFTRLQATLLGREGDLHRWPPRTGERTLL